MAITVASLKIPERYRPGVLVLAGLSDPAFGELTAAVRQANGPFATATELESQIAPLVKTIPSDDLKSLLYTVSSLYRVSTRLNVPVGRLARDVFESAQRDLRDFRVGEGVDFVGRLSVLLAVESFDVLAFKARELQAESERTLCEARVLTDLRPVFGDKPDSGPTGMIVVHTLKLVFHERSGHREFFLALDEEDISTLKKSLERAEMKAQSLKELLERKDLHPIDLP